MKKEEITKIPKWKDGNRIARFCEFDSEEIGVWGKELKGGKLKELIDKVNEIIDVLNNENIK